MDNRQIIKQIIQSVKDGKISHEDIGKALKELGLDVKSNAEFRRVQFHIQNLTGDKNGKSESGQ